MAEEKHSLEYLRSLKLPRHVAIIMDGNGRWAQKRFLPRVAGHKSGVDTVRQIVQMTGDLGIEVLTLFTFSSENWRRPPAEVNLLMDLFLSALEREVRKMHENGIQLRIIGDTSAFNEKLQQRIREAEALTKNNTNLVLAIAANYGGQWDITQATRKVAARVERGELSAMAIREEDIRRELCLSDLPEPDLFIRSGGEKRISNFLVWQLAYTELYFTDILWPDFDHKAYAEAILSFTSRQRRFGQTGDQVAKANNA